MTNALQALLGATPTNEITTEVFIKRLNTPFTIKALNGDDIDKVRAQATYSVRENKKVVQKVNDNEVSRLLVAKATVEPNFADAALLKHFNAVDAGECVQKALLAGEIALLQEEILTLAGFSDDDTEEIDEIKN